MAEKPKVAMYWCASCGGCEESVVDLAEDILFVVENVDIIFWPVAMDFKRSDVEKFADGEILVSMINGAIRSSEQYEMAQLLRKKSKIMIAYGACSHMGGIPSLANEFRKELIQNYVYSEAPTVSNPDETRPQPILKENGREVELPVLWETVRALDQVVDVDYYIPGCPPTPKILKNALVTLLSGNLPPKGTVLSPDVALCDECPRKDTKPTDLQFKEFKRPHLVEIDPELCFLAQGLICMGPATRSGCEALCIGGNMPCSGCFGPTSRVRDHGAKFLSSIASSVDAKTEPEIDEILNGIPDPVGTFYRYGLAKSTLHRRLNL
ncbi:MAG: oxidoreductase [Ignavibacteria bacterium]|nr:oxidoreductase [Ignavibacteria bacterium]